LRCVCSSFQPHRINIFFSSLVFSILYFLSPRVAPFRCAALCVFFVSTPPRAEQMVQPAKAKQTKKARCSRRTG
jgi:hypothetical protein